MTENLKPPPSSGSSGGVAHTVVVVLVCHNGERYLPRTLAALAELSPAPDHVIAVDTGSADGTPRLLAQASGASNGVVDRVLTLPAESGFADAVHAAVADAPGSEWLWLLHDDSAPEPDALGVLLRSAADQPSVAAWGPKVLGWDEPRRLLEIGVSISRSGHRFTGLEPAEHDQGQYDGQHDVLAVGSAGLLVRRNVWSDLGGFERSMHFFREDVDFGWRINLAGHRAVVTTDAVVHHAEAMARGRRTVQSASTHRATAAVFDPYSYDRASALFTLLANARPSTWLLRWLWLLLQTLVRALGFVLGKAPREAAAEMAAVATVLLRPGRLWRVRRSRRRWRDVPQRSLQHLFPPVGQQLRHTIEGLVASLAIESDVQADDAALESGPGDDDLESFAAVSTGRLRRLIRRPGVLLFTGLLLVQLVAWRGLYRGGVLHGGALLPVPRGASDVWQSYTASWHPVTLGSDTMAHPATAVLGVFSTLLLGHASWVVPVVLVAGPPTAGVLAYHVTGSLGLSRRLRCVVGVVYALNPVSLAATAQGRWTTVLVQVLLPLAAVAAARCLGLGAAAASIRATAVAVLLLSVLVAVAPPLVVPVALLTIVAVLVLKGRRRIAAAALLGGPLVVLSPWWGVVAHDPTVLLLEPGVRLTVDNEPPWHAVFFDPGGWWSLPWWVGIGLVLAALAAVLRVRQTPPVRVAVLVLGGALLWALVLESITVTVDNAATPVDPWSGSVLLLALAAALVATAVAARGAGRRLSHATFSWRQPAVAIVTALAIASPVVWTVGWLAHGATGPLDRGTADPMPAFVRAQAALPEQIRTLVLRPQGGRLVYTLLRNRGAEWGDVETAPSTADMASMDTVVSDLASGRGAAPVTELADRAVQYVLAVAPVAADLEIALDSAPGLLRVANPGDASLWRVQEDTARVRLSADGQRENLASEVPGDPGAARVHVAAPSAGASADQRVLDLAELADDRWQAVSTPESANDGTAGEGTSQGTSQELQASTSGWSQSFALDANTQASAVTVTMSVDDVVRRWTLWGQLVVVVLLVLVALPGRTRRDEEAV
jgi:GT2 family glycosyltransferase